jgi:hypothetical protein
LTQACVPLMRQQTESHQASTSTGNAVSSSCSKDKGKERNGREAISSDDFISRSADIGVSKAEDSKNRLLCNYSERAKNDTSTPNPLAKVSKINYVVNMVDTANLQVIESHKDNNEDIFQQQIGDKSPAVFPEKSSEDVAYLQTDFVMNKSGNGVSGEKARNESRDQSLQNDYRVMDSLASEIERVHDNVRKLCKENLSTTLSNTVCKGVVNLLDPSSKNRVDPSNSENYADSETLQQAARSVCSHSSHKKIAADSLILDQELQSIQVNISSKNDLSSTSQKGSGVLPLAREPKISTSTKANVKVFSEPNVSKDAVDLTTKALHEIVDLTVNDSVVISQPSLPPVVEPENGSTIPLPVKPANQSISNIQQNNSSKFNTQETHRLSVNNKQIQNGYQNKPRAIVETQTQIIKPQNYPIYHQQPQQHVTAQQQQQLHMHNQQLQVPTTLPQQQHHVQTNQQRQHALILHQQAIQHQQALFHQQKLQQQLAWEQHQKQVQLIAEQQKQEVDARRQQEKVLRRQQTEATFRAMMLNTPIKFDISIGYTPLGPPNQPELFSLFNQLTSAMGYTFRNLALMVLKVRQGGPSSGTQSKVALALSHVYCEQMLADWPRDKVKRAECPSVVYALVLRSAFYSDVIQSSSVCFPHSFSSLVESFYILRDRMVEMPDTHPVLKGYITGTISQPSFTGRLNELEYFHHMCQVYNLFPNGMTISHPKYSFPEESAYDETMNALEIARESRSMSFRSIVSTSVCDIVDDDIVADDPLCFLVFESLELVQVNRHYCLPDHRHLFEDTSVSQDEVDLFAVKCKRCYDLQESQRDKSELVLLRNSKECNIGITKLVFLHLPNFLSGHRLYKFEMLRRQAKEDNFASFAKSLRRHVASIFRWTQKVLEVTKSSTEPTEDNELWKNLSMTQFRGLLESEGFIEVANIIEPGKSNGEPGCAVKEYETFPKIGILHGKIEFPTRSDLKFNLKKRKALDSPEDKAMIGSKVKHLIELPPVDLGKAQQYLQSSSLVVIEDPHPYSYSEDDAFDQDDNVEEKIDSKQQAIIDNQAIMNSPSLPTFNQQSGQVINSASLSSVKIKDRKLTDGSIYPLIEPSRDENGRFLRPTGRGFKGMNWDEVRGLWVPPNN